jgi:DNA-binding MarR family transcriptional regulator
MKSEDFDRLPFIDEYQRLVSNIYFTWVYIGEKFQAILRPYGITLQQYNVLGLLYKFHPNPLSLQDIKNGLFEPKADASRLVERLKAKGLLKTRIDPMNKRKIEIRLTSKGNLLAKKVVSEGAAFVKDVTSTISLNKARELNTTLDTVRNYANNSG